MTNQDDLGFGAKLRQFRILSGVNQEEFANKLSISRGTLINYEKGYTQVPLDFLLKIKEVYPNFESLDQIEIELENKIITDGYIDFSFLLKVILNGKKTILFFLFLFILLGCLYIMITPNLYQAKLTLYPDEENQNNFGQIQNIVSSFGLPLQNFQEHGFSIPDIIKSRRIKDAVLDTLWYSAKLKERVSLINYWSVDEKIFTFFSRNRSKSDIEKSKKEESRLILGKRIGVNENRNTGLISITFNHEEPIMASNIVEFLSNSTQAFIQSSILQKANREKDFIMNRLKLSKSEMVFAEETLKEFQSNNRSIEKSPELQMVQNRLRRNVESKQMVVNTLEQQLEISRIEAERTKPVLYVLDQAESKLDPIKPRKILVMFLSLFLGLMIGSLVVITKI